MKLLQLAAQIALSGNRGKLGKNYLLAAVAKRKDGALVFSQNAMTRQPHPTSHAEARAIRKSDAGCTMYVARVYRDGGKWALAKPCPKCQSLIRNHHVLRVYYTIEEGRYGVWDVEKNHWRVVDKAKS
jgi:tRNA(Arg) A34 adenosine deaminase TadA